MTALALKPNGATSAELTPSSGNLDLSFSPTMQEGYRFSVIKGVLSGLRPKGFIEWEVHSGSFATMRIERNVATLFDASDTSLKKLDLSSAAYIKLRFIGENRRVFIKICTDQLANKKQKLTKYFHNVVSTDRGDKLLLIDSSK